MKIRLSIEDHVVAEKDVPVWRILELLDIKDGEKVQHYNEKTGVTYTVRERTAAAARRSPSSPPKKKRGASSTIHGAYDCANCGATFANRSSYKTHVRRSKIRGSCPALRVPSSSLRSERSSP